VVQKHHITPKRTFAVDEIGMQGSLGQPERVIRARQMGLQYQQRDGGHKIIMVLVTICADGVHQENVLVFFCVFFVFIKTKKDKKGKKSKRHLCLFYAMLTFLKKKKDILYFFKTDLLFQ
jgi:hypothetical protein